MPQISIRAHPAMAVVGALLVVAAVFVWCRPTSAPVPAREQHSIDSLAITAPIFQAQQQELVKVETTYVTKSATAERSAASFRESADSFHRIADSLQAIAESSHDTTSTWRATALTRQKEADSLRVSNDSLRSALEAQKIARMNADARAANDSTRRVAVEDLNKRLKHDVETAGQCRLLPFVRCPTRTETAVGGIVIGAIAEFNLHPKINLPLP